MPEPLSIATRRLSYRLDAAALMGVSPQCNLQCEGCHQDFFPIRVPFDASFTRSFAESIALVEAALSMPPDHPRVVHISGRAEPLLLRSRLFDLVSQLRAAFPEWEQVLITNGIGMGDMAAGLAAAGLRRVNLSAHAGITPVVRKSVLLLRALGISAKLNVIISAKVTRDVAEYIDFAMAHGCSLKLFPRLGSNNSIPDDVANVLDAIRKTSGTQGILDAGLYRMRFQLSDGVSVDVKLDMTRRYRPPACVACPYSRLCLEGCWDSVRITPWYIKPCGVREDNVYFFAEDSISVLRGKLYSGGKSRACVPECSS